LYQKEEKAMRATDTWLTNLKPGEEVVISSNRRLWFGVVERRTPSGRIIVQSNSHGMTEFNPDGYERGRRDSIYQAHLTEPTQAIRDQIERSDLVGRMSIVRWDKVSLDKLRRIAAVLDEKPV
jgi:hypothetical protein